MGSNKDNRKRRPSVSSASTDTSVELRKQKQKQREKDRKQDKKIEKTKEKVKKEINKVEHAIHETEENLEKKVAKKIHKAEGNLEQKVAKKIHKAEDAIEHKVEKKLNKVEDAVENKVLKGIYQKLKYKLRRNGCLYVNGADAFISAWAKNAQTIEAGEPVVFECAAAALNVDFKNDTGVFHICRDGLYTFEFAGVFDVSGALALAVNDATVPSTITTFVAGQQSVIQGILPLKKGTCIKFWNYDLSGGNVLTTAVLPYEAVNVSFTLQRIAPWTKKFGGCCPLPPLPKYDSESDCESKCSRKSRRSRRSRKSSRSSCSSDSSWSSDSTCSTKKSECKPKPKKPCSRKSSRSSRSSRSSSRSSRSSGISTASHSSSDYSCRRDKKGCRGRK
jgi:hypothetical protein